MEPKDKKILIRNGIPTDNLPALQPGKVWGIRIYPGGRKELRQCPPGNCLKPDAAIARLQDGHMVEVKIRDAVETLQVFYKLAKSGYGNGPLIAP